MPPKSSAEGPSGVLSAGQLWRALTGEVRVLHELLSGVSSGLMSAQYRLNKMSLNRNTWKTRLHIDQLTEMGPGAPRNLTPHFP